MKKIILFFIVLLGSVWLGITMYHNSGYVLITYNGWTVETSLWFAVVILIVLFTVFYFLLRCFYGINLFAAFIKRWFSNLWKRRARIKTVLGLYDFIEGNWARSEQRLFKAAKHSDMPLINYLVAAFTAQCQGVFERRDRYLFLAQTVSDQHPVVVGIAQAKLQILNNQWEEALASLQQLHKARPKNSLILRLLQETCLALKDWSELKNILPLLHKYKVLDPTKLEQLELEVYYQILLASKSDATIEVEWYALPQHLKKQPLLAAIYAEYLLTHGKSQEAETILKYILSKVLDRRLLEIYAVIPSENPIKKIARAENWLKNNPENADLLLCLGRICKQQKLWGKARQYLEKSMRLTPNSAVYLELGQIMEMQNDMSKALNYYGKGLQVDKKG